VKGGREKEEDGRVDVGDLNTTNPVERKNMPRAFLGGGGKKRKTERLLYSS